MIFIQPKENMRHSFMLSLVQVKKDIHNKRFNYSETGHICVIGLKMEM